MPSFIHVTLYDLWLRGWGCGPGGIIKSITITIISSSTSPPPAPDFGGPYIFYQFFCISRCCNVFPDVFLCLCLGLFSTDPLGTLHWPWACLPTPFRGRGHAPTPRHWLWAHLAPVAADCPAKCKLNPVLASIPTWPNSSEVPGLLGCLLLTLRDC